MQYRLRFFCINKLCVLRKHERIANTETQTQPSLTSVLFSSTTQQGSACSAVSSDDPAMVPARNSRVAVAGPASIGNVKAGTPASMKAPTWGETIQE